MPDYPVQPSKVQAPPLREETLARDRLLDWLSVKVHRRAILLIAEAGYGKTTLLADFTRRTRVRLLWFRLDRGDRDWVGFIAHLVAAVAIHVAGFGGATKSLLRETATAAPTLDAVLDTFLRELSALPQEPCAIVFDDFHLVDDAPEIRHVVRELLSRAPERMSLVFASRREPPIRLARLRALGEVAELGTDDLRFDQAETERLFRETYDMPIEKSVLAELNRRTEGWAASLQLVRAALHDRNPGQVRTFIASLSGAEGHLYEYLAEEVIGELPEDLQDFLMKTSVLDVVDLTLGPIAAGVSAPEASRLLDEAMRSGLLGRTGPRNRAVGRAHPLIREFLRERLVRSVGFDGLQAIHLLTARAAEGLDWRTAAWHYLGAQDPTSAARVIGDSLETILATGALSAADELAQALPAGELGGVPGLVLSSRLALRRGDADEGLQLAELALAADADSAAAQLNLVGARTLTGDISGAMEASRALQKRAGSEAAELSRIFLRLLDASLLGSVEAADRELEALATRLQTRSQLQFLGIARLNLSHLRLVRGRIEEALDAAEAAIAILETTSSPVELASARLARAQALAFSYRIDESRAEMDTALAEAPATQTVELAGEIGWTEALFGEGSRVQDLVDRATRGIQLDGDGAEQAIQARALINTGMGSVAEASRDLQRARFGVPTTTVSFEARRHLFRGLVDALKDEVGAIEHVRHGTEIAQKQGADLWTKYGQTLEALIDPRTSPSAAVVALSRSDRPVLSMLAEAIARRLGELSDDALAVVEAEATKRPWRWRSSIRVALGAADGASRVVAGQLLERIGDRDDVRALRAASRDPRDQHSSRLGMALARRLAPKVVVEDLGRVVVVRGSERIEGTEVRRKVLALLCLLLTKPRFSLPRDEVVDQMWPDADPSSALNSLNQTVYFLRRVFEPAYSEDTSPGYVGQDGETIWLDAELVTSRSHRAWELVRSSPGQPSGDVALALARTYVGQFAVDFMYEEWAIRFREALHAAYLRIMEQAIRLDLDSGLIARGTFLAQQAAAVEPESEEIHLALTRLYRQAGAHAAAAEQYRQYARVTRDLGIEPVPISDV